MIDGKYKMVVVETPEADRILKSVNISLNQLKKLVQKAVFSDRRVHMVVQEGIQKQTGVLIPKEDCIRLVNIIVHFGTKAVHGSDFYQEDGKVKKNGKATKHKPSPEKLLDTK